MGYLDELKVQAEQREVLDRAAKKRTEQLEAIYQEKILPKLEQVFTYLSEVTSHLNQLDMGIKVDYKLGDLVHLEGLQQKNYAVRADSSNQMKEVTLTIDCVDEGSFESSVDGKITVEKWTRYLQEHHLKYHTKLQLDERKSVNGALFVIERFIPVTFKFTADIENSNINLSMHNFDDLGVRQVQFSPDSINEDTMDKLGKYIARKSKSFFDLEISDSERQRLRAKVLYEQQQREMELLASDNKLHNDVATTKKKGLLGMFKGKKGK